MQVEVRVNGSLLSVTEIVNITAQEVAESNEAYYNHQEMTKHMSPRCGPPNLSDPVLKHVPEVCNYRVRFFDFTDESEEPMQVEKTVIIAHDSRKNFTDLIAKAYTKLYNEI